MLFPTSRQEDVCHRPTECPKDSLHPKSRWNAIGTDKHKPATLMLRPTIGSYESDLTLTHPAFAKPSCLTREGINLGAEFDPIRDVVSKKENLTTVGMACTNTAP